MAAVSYGSTSTRPRSANDFVYGTGATLDASNLIQLNWDQATFDLTTAEGKERLHVTVEMLMLQLIAAVSRSATTPASFK